MVHKPKHKVHSFRGLLGDGGQDEINLERQNVNLAYRIVKFQMIGPDSHENIESTMKVYRESQDSIDDDINFGDPTLLAAGILLFPHHSSNTAAQAIIFDNVLFSRNIYVTLSGHGYQVSVNYYIEIEEVPVPASALMQIKLGTARRNIGGSMGN